MKRSAIVGAIILLLPALLEAPALLAATDKFSRHDSLAEYIQRVQQEPVRANPASPGSLWVDNGLLANLAADYKAVRVGDLIRILVVQDLTAVNSGDVATDRNFKANSGIDGLFGHIGASGVQNIFAPHSSATLQGKAQASSKSSLRTSVAGRVVAVLASGTLVVEANRELVMNNEKQTILVRGLIRPGDIAPDNTVLSNAIGNLELELKGKGVLSEGTRPPNVIVRLLLRVVGF
ncbi:MAG: flagellar biosynthesis protein FlgH [Acidobacteria bacterium]|nr:MAG: flagellar biosynthesis protein FlgH [Acidobacteriota bacterium]